MLKNQHVVVALLLTLAGAGIAQETKRVEVVIQGISVLDVAAGVWLPQRDVVIRGTRIASVTPVGGELPPAKFTINGAGKFAIPGLFDSHVRLAPLTDETLGTLVAHGVTTVRDGGTDPARLVAWQRGIDHGKFMGPRILNVQKGASVPDPPGALPGTSESSGRPGVALHDVLARLVAVAGVGPADVLRRATIASATSHGRAADLGSIEPGKIADLLVLTADPLADITNTRRIDAVIYRGETLTRAHLNVLLERAK